VINKMLRDLDQRQAAPVRGDDQPLDTALRRNTVSVGSASALAVGRFNNAAIAVACVMLALVLGAATWWWQRTPVMAAAPVASQTAPAAEPISVPALAPTPATPKAMVTAPMEQPPQAPTVAQTPAPLQTAKAVAKPALAHEASAKPVSVTPAPGKTGRPAAPIASAATLVSIPTTAPAVTNPPAVADPQAAQGRQLQAGREALAQAQSLWNAGSHDAANELLQQALALAERTAGSAPSAANTQLLASLAREQARMQLADGRPQAALEGLTRLEPLLGREADAWALRGNAAQRLGRHQDSLQAYTTALQSRPNEQRWLLGAAVSLAALGQTANAADMAAKARALGPISKEVQAYLRQAGVHLNEP
jgi:tetratricopeptide (TPR) repeat protein